MLQPYSRIKIADNSGAKIISIIRVIGKVINQVVRIAEGFLNSPIFPPTIKVAIQFLTAKIGVLFTSSKQNTELQSAKKEVELKGAKQDINL